MLQELQLCEYQEETGNQQPWERYILKKTASLSHKLDIDKWGNWLFKKDTPYFQGAKLDLQILLVL